MNTTRSALAQLSESELLERFETLVACERRNTTQLLVAIAEIDERKLWAKHACPSMFVFCGRSRDDHLWPPPPQIPACGTTAPGSCRRW